jgi:isopentenyl-diphosphate delta-isomerase
MQNSLILVDQFGRRTGVAARSVCHQGKGVRHRAFVIFITTGDGRILVQKRAGSKLGGDCWDVSATSHVWSNESYAVAINRCLFHELGITDAVKSEYRLAYSYHQQLGDSAEYEHCSLFVINYDGKVSINAREVEEVRWVSYAELKNWFEQDASLFTHWFEQAFRRMIAP